MYQRWSWINAWVSLNYHDILLQEVYKSANVGKPSIFPLSLPSFMWNSGTYQCSHCPGQIAEPGTVHTVRSVWKAPKLVCWHLTRVFLLLTYVMCGHSFFFLDPKFGTYEKWIINSFSGLFVFTLAMKWMTGKGDYGMPYNFHYYLW